MKGEITVLTSITNFLKELRRRNVFKVGVAYAIVAWLIIQVADITFPALNIPQWAFTLVTVLIIIGFPIAILLAWAFELTPEGVQQTQDDDPFEPKTGNTKGKFVFFIIGLLVIALIFLLLDNYVWVEKASPPAVSTSIETRTEKSVEPAVVVDRKSVAVLPFANRSDEKKDAYFVDGIHDDILTQLAKIASLKVISRTSVMQYRDTQKTMKVIGEELGVATIMEGGVQRAGNRVRINVQLIDADTDEHLWAETYNKELTAANIFEMQEQIATAIAQALRATLSPEEQERIAAVPTENLAAYEAYLLGKQRMAKRTSGNLAEAVDYFQQATTLDPVFALAYVGLSDSYQLHTLYSDLPQAEMNTLSKNAINMALALNDNLAEAYASLGLLRQNNHDFSGAKVAYLKAMTLNPNYATTYHWYGTLLEQLGKVTEASEQMQKALSLDPLSIIINAGVASYHAQLGRFDEAMTQFEKIIEIDPTSIHGYGGKARLYWSVYGRLDKAAPLIRKAVSLDPNNPKQLAYLGRLFLELGDDKQAECWLNRAIKSNPKSFELNLFKSFLHAYRDENNQALSYARTAIKKNPSDRGVLKFFRDLDLRAGSYDKARSRYEKTYPVLLSEDEPTINNTNYDPAIDLAYVLQLTGEQERADLLLDRSLAFIRGGMPRLDFTGYGIADVRIYALRGEKQLALTTLRQAIDEGWRDAWWYFLELDSNLDSIRNEPKFQAMLEEIKADMANQLTRVKEMEKEGDVCVNP
jgi:TolB-like protein/Tfp pilus assembly protein PilF